MAKRKNPLVAAILSLIIAGLGHIYLGKFLSGVVLLSLEAITCAIFLYHADLGGFLNITVSIFAAYDAYKLASGMNRSKGGSGETERDAPEVYIN